MLTVEEARARVLDAVDPLEPQEVSLEGALGLVTATDLMAPHALPRFDNSAMDGFAVRGQETATASEDTPIALEITGEVKAGDRGLLRVQAGSAAKIMTGAPLPDGADAVVPIEEVEDNGYRVVVKAPTPSGRNVRPAGDDLDEGDVAVRAGTELGAGELALLASLGLSPLTVRRGPYVAVVVTGEELVGYDDRPRAGQIRDSNSHALSALVLEAGGALAVLTRVPDRRSLVVEALDRASQVADLIVSSGGVAVGEYDFVKEAVDELGHIDLWRVAMQPGKPVVLGAVNGIPFLGLPGNPVSVHVGFEQFVRPAIRKTRGCAGLLRPRVTARLTDGLEKKPGRLHFVRVRLHADAGGWRATPTGAQGSHIQSSLVDCHGVALFGADETKLDAGAEVLVEVWRLPEQAADR